ncbi:LysR substrate-binding domain-containing protein [Cupriavidus necator]|nr:LysR substrate-binding domain-containing protein [Cupriavidus necator]
MLVKANDAFSDRFADLAEDGFDLVVRTGELADRAGVVARRIARQRMVVCASPDYLGRHGVPVRVEEIVNHQGILYRRSGQIRPWIFPRPDQQALALTPPNRLRLDDLDAIADAAVQGMGLAWLPYWLVRERIQAGTLVQLFPNQAGFLYDVFALWLQTPHLPRKVRLAIDALVEGLPGYMS